ncbi:MAG: methylmalonyl Co-A mutase-associated GTPase MeaB [Acidimicrobiales bacterium]|nr:methylmalonyl Co-A mutase-associated GTPase MeaB [Acidimicrobiales bacterium]
MNSSQEPIPQLFKSALSGERRSLGKLLTIIERGGETADTVAGLAHQKAGSAHVVGVTGAPGSGKSTLTGRLIDLFSKTGYKTAVLAVDPSSPLTGGAILGDRIRMDDLAGEDCFIRSMATRGHSGGLALAVPAAIQIFDAVGYNPVIIETVGVGQVEVDVAGTADTTVVVVTPGMGDAVQANKAGLLEVADIFVVNKADRPGANDARRDLELMLDLGHVSGLEEKTGYRPPIIMANSLEGTGSEETLKAIKGHAEHLKKSGSIKIRQKQRILMEIQNRIEILIGSNAKEVLETDLGIANIEAVLNRVISPAEAAKLIVNSILND